MEEFKLPDFLQADEEEFHEMMVRTAKADTDTAEGSLYWDNTRPTAMIADRLVSYELTMALMMKFPQFAEGQFLDWHGYPIGVYRRPAISAVGEVTFVGTEGTVIPDGTLVTTIGDDNEDSYLFRVEKGGVIDVSEQLTLRIEAVEPGLLGIVPAKTIVGVTSSIKGLKSLSNASPTINGAGEEDDDSYRIRILDRNRNKPLSGAKRDYVRWAKEVPGVGDVIVLPLWNGPKTVKVLITDVARDLASSELIATVKNYIDPVDGMGEGVAPIGAVVTIDTLALVPVDLKLSIVLEESYLLADALLNIKRDVDQLLADKEVVKYTDVFTAITDTDGVKDHSGLLMNGSIDNIPLSEGERATIGEVMAV